MGPPPLAYHHLESKKGHFGTSLSAFVNMLGSLYALIQVEFVNALFLRRDIADELLPEHRDHAVVEKWAAGFFCNPNRPLWNHETDLQLNAGSDARFLADPGSALHLRAESLLGTI